MKNVFVRSMLLTFCLMMVGIMRVGAQSWEHQISPLYDSLSLVKILKERKEFYTQNIVPKNLKEKEKFYRKEYEDWVKDFLMGLEEEYDIRNLVQNKSIDSLFQKVMVNITTNNTDLPKDFKLFLTRSPQANAMSLGEKTILINEGLLVWLDSEDELGYILCHEIAHFILNHHNKKIDLNISARKLDEEKRLIKNIRNGKYKSNTALKKYLVENLKYKRHHSRNFELEADSLAMIYFLNTKYNPYAAKTALEKLDLIDDDYWGGKLDFNIFNISAEKKIDTMWYQLDFSNSWDVEKDTSDQIFLDSLKTHPDAQLRAKIAATKLEQMKATMKQSSNLARIKTIAEDNLAFEYFLVGKFDKALYYNLQQLQNDPDNLYYKTLFSIIIHHIYWVTKNHLLDKYVQSPDKEMDTNYNQLLFFINNIPFSYFTEYVSKPRDIKVPSNELTDFDDLIYLYILKDDSYKEKANDYKKKYKNSILAIWVPTSNE